MNFKFILSSIIIIINLALFGQSNIDSLKNLLSTEINKTKRAIILSELCKSYTYLNTDSSIYFGEISLNLFKSIKHKESDIHNLYYNLGTTYLDKNLSKSSIFYKKSYQYALKTENDSLIAANDLALAAYYSRIPNIDSSSYHTIKATEHFKTTKDSIALAYCYYNLMSNYNDVKNDKKSLEYGELGYEIAKTKKLEPVLTYLIINMAFTYTSIEGKEKIAETFLNKAKQIALKSNNLQILTSVYMSLGGQKMKSKDYYAALENYKEALNRSIEANDSMRISMAYSSIGNAYYRLNNFSKAAENFKNDILTNRNTPLSIQSNYLYLTMIYANNDSKQHLYYLNKYDSISKVITAANSEEILAKFETSEKERQIELLKLKETENNLLIQKKNFRNTLLISALLLTSLIVAFLFYRNKNNKTLLTQKIVLEKQKVIQTENELALKLEALRNNNSLISELKEKLKENSKNDELLDSIISSFEKSYVSEKQWDNIILQFNKLEKDFIQNLKEKYSNLSKNDIKLSILLKLNYSNSGMAEILNISIEGIKKAKQRLKKKKIK